MTGVMKIAEPFLRLVAKIAIHRGRLRVLEDTYCKTADYIEYSKTMSDRKIKKGKITPKI